MKRNLSILLLSCVAIMGCTTTQQRTNYNTLASVDATAKATVDGYYLAAAKGLADTNGIPVVSKAYNDLESILQVAVLLAQNNSNAIAPSNVVQELSVIVSTVAQFTPTSIKQITPTP